MSDPVVDTQFTTGTVITADWLNGVNDFVNTDGATKVYADAVGTAIRIDLASTSDAAKGAAMVGYKSPLTGAAARTLYTKAQDVVSVKDFGAVGDGVTNDAPAIQAAIDALDPNGELYFPDGTYKINVALNVPAVSGNESGLSFRGNGLGSIITPGAAMTALMNITGKHVLVEGLFFNNASSFSTNGILNTTPSADASHSSRIRKNYFVGFTNAFSGSGQNYDITENWFQDNGTHVKFTNDGRNSSIHSNYLLGGNNGIILEKTSQQCEGMRIFNNTILPTLGSGSGITIAAGLDIFIGHNVIDQTGASSPGIFMASGANTIAKVKIVGNWIAAGQNSYSIFASGNTADLTMIGNSIMSNNALAALAGISLSSTNGFQITDNNFGIVTGTDLSLSSTSNGTIHGNTSSQGSSSNAILNVVSQPIQFVSGSNTATIQVGSGSPSGSVTAAAGSLFLRTDGGVGGHLYVSNGGTTWNAVAGV